MNTSGLKWTEEAIIREIELAVDLLKIERMPTSVELKRVFNDSKLINAIRRNGGFKFFADKLNLNQSNCETRIGLFGELHIKGILENKNYYVEKMSVKHPYDLLVNKQVKLDVKTANLTTTDTYSYYSFNLEKSSPTCDIYVFVCIEEEVIQKILIIPSKFLNQTQLSIGKKTKYDVYKDRWDYIDTYNKFYESIKGLI